MARLVWAFEALDQLNGETGYVEVADEALAEKLIGKGAVQDPHICGADLKHIESASIQAYATRQLKAGEAAPRATPERPERAPKPEPEVEGEAPTEAPTRTPEAPTDPARKRGRPPGSASKAD